MGVQCVLYVSASVVVQGRVCFRFALLSFFSCFCFLFLADRSATCVSLCCRKCLGKLEGIDKVAFEGRGVREHLSARGDSFLEKKNCETIYPTTHSSRRGFVAN